MWLTVKRVHLSFKTIFNFLILCWFSGDGRAFFLLQKEFTDLYLRLYQQKDKAVIAEEFNNYMKKMEAGEGARDTSVSYTHLTLPTNSRV